MMSKNGNFILFFKTWTKLSKNTISITIDRRHKTWRYHIFEWVSEWVLELSQCIFLYAHECVKDRIKFAVSIEAKTGVWRKWLRFDAPWTCRITRPLPAAVERKAKNASIRGEHLHARGPRSPRSMTTWKVGARTNARAGAGKTEWRKKERSTFGLAVGGGRRTRDIARGWRVIDHEHSANTTWRRARWFSFDTRVEKPPPPSPTAKCQSAVFENVACETAKEMEHDERDGKRSRRLAQHLGKTCQKLTRDLPRLQYVFHRFHW